MDSAKLTRSHLASIPDRILAGGPRALFAIFLAIWAGIIALWHGAYLIWSFLILIEMTQVEPRFFTTMYAVVALGLSIVWAGAHTTFMRKYKPEKEGNSTTKVSSVDISRAQALIWTLFITVLWITATSLIFSSRWPGAIAPGDGHVVQNGMDTKSALYTIWLMIQFSLILSCAHICSNTSYLFDLYLSQFLYPGKMFID